MTRHARECACPDCWSLERRRAVLNYRRALLEPEHGTRNRYRKGCRCSECRDAAAEYRQHRRALSNE